MTAIAQIQQGDTLREQGQLEAAAAAYQQAIQQDPQSVEAYQRLAEVLQAMGRLNPAAQAYQQAIALHPETHPSEKTAPEMSPPMASPPPAPSLDSPSEPSSDLLSDAAKSAFPESTPDRPDFEVKLSQTSPSLSQLQEQIAQRQWDLAMEMSQQLVEDDPSPDAYKLLGNVYQHKGRLDEALNAYKQALTLDPDFAEVWSNLGSLYARQESWEAALQALERAIAIQPAFAGAYRNLARVWERLDRLEAAADCWYQAMLLQPEAGSAADYVQLGAQLLLWKRVDQAMDCFQTALHQDPNHPEAAQWLTELQQRPGEPAAGIQPASPLPQSTPQPSESERVAIARQRIQDGLAAQDWQGMIPYCQYVVERDPDADTYRMLGRSLQQLGNLDAALQAYSQALTLQPDLPEVYANLGTVYAQQQRWPEAVQHFQQAIALNPEFAGAYRNLARAWERLGKLESAMDCWYRAVQLEPGSFAAGDLSAFGDRFLLWNQLEQALTCYKLALSQDPSQVRVRHRLAQLLSQLGQWEAATAQYQALMAGMGDPTVAALALQQQGMSPLEAILASVKAANAEPEMLERTMQLLSETQAELLAQTVAGYRQRGNLAREQADWEMATRSYEQLLALDDSTARDWGNLGTLYAQQGRLEAAVECYQRAIALEGDRASFHWNLGQVLGQLDRSEAAAAAYYQALTLEPERATAEQHWGLGDIFARQEKPDWAIACYERALLVDPNCGQALLAWGDLLTAQGDLDGAVERYRQAAERNPDQAEYWHRLGDGLNRVERWTDAVEAFGLAIALNPEFSWSHNNQGDALLKLERWAEAAAAYRRAIVLNPEFHWSHYNLGEALAKLEDWDGAIEAYQRALDLKPETPKVSQKLADALKLRSKRDQERSFFLYQKSIRESPNQLENYYQALAIDSSCTQLYVTLGDALHRDRDANSAIACYNLALLIDAHCASAHFRLGQVLFNTKNYIHSKIHLKKATELEPSVSTYYALGLVLEKLEEFTAAVNSYEQVLTLHSRHSQSTSHKFLCLLKSHRVKEAMTFFCKASINAETHIEASLLLSEKEYLEEASICCQRALEIDFQNSKAHEQMGNIFRKQEKIDDARLSYERAIAVDPQNSQAYQHLIGVLQDMSLWSQATKVCRKFLGKFPENHWGYCCLGDLYLQTQNPEEATQAYRYALRLQPKDPQIQRKLNDSLLLLESKKTSVAKNYLERSEDFEREQKLDEAVNYCHQAIEIQPSMIDAYIKMCDLLQQKGETDELLKCCFQAITIFPNFYNFHSRLVWIEMTDSQLNQALELCRQSLEKPLTLSSSSVVQYVLGYLLSQKGNIEAAVVAYKGSSHKKALLKKPDIFANSTPEALSKGPNFFIIGGMRCGSTSLYSYINYHPKVLEAATKEIHFFNTPAYQNGLTWYLSHFPYIPEHQNLLTGEATPCLTEEKCAWKLYKFSPDIKLIVILRNPVDRAYSHYHHALRNHSNYHDFLEAVSPDITEGYNSFRNLREQYENLQSDYIRHSLYVHPLQEWMKVFPKSNFLILRSEDLYSNPTELMKKVFNFLELENYNIENFKAEQKGNYPKLSHDARKALINYFEPHNRLLEEYLNMEFGWLN
jgi:tetratricopeptide (TPR) repeat protein